MNIDINKAFQEFFKELATEFDATEENQFEQMKDTMQKCFLKACKNAITKKENISSSSSSEEDDDDKKNKKNTKLTGYNIFMSQQMKNNGKSMKEAVSLYQQLSDDEKQKFKVIANKKNANNNKKNGKANGNGNGDGEKKKLTGYNLFMSKAMSKKEGRGLPLAEAVKEWQALSDNEKKEWKQKATEL